MTDILTRLAGLQPEHPAIAELREYIRRGFGFVAYGPSQRIWTLTDGEIRALNTGFAVLDDDRKTLIALVQEAAGEIEQLRKLAAESRDALDAAIPCIGRDSSSLSTQYALRQAKEQRERCELALNPQEVEPEVQP
jgi:hypothetical protein